MSKLLLSGCTRLSLVVAGLAAIVCLASSAAVYPRDRCLRPAETGPEVVGVYLSLGYWNQREIEQVFAELERCGVNLVIDYALQLPENESWNDEFAYYLQTAYEHNVGIAFVLYPLLDGMTPLNANSYYRTVAQAVDRLKCEPAITAWYVHDEVLPWITDAPEQDKYTITLNGMKQLYLSIKEADDSRPQLNVWNHLPSFESFHNVYKDGNAPHGMPEYFASAEKYEAALAGMLRETCDIVLIDLYPVDAPWREDDNPPEYAVSEMLRRASALKSPQQPMYFVFQAFSWAQYNAERCRDCRFPTIDEMRAMLAAARECQAAGAIAYSWFDLAEDGIAGRDVPGRDHALRNLQLVLGGLANEGWPLAPGSSAAAN
jgi:hypothetical protein